MNERTYDLIAVGGGTAGLVTAAGAAHLGARPALVERTALGGDCLWTGCVPSKALIASARLAHGMRNAEEMGLRGASPGHAFSEVMERMRRARATVAHHDDPERFRAMGVDVLEGEARFAGPGLLEVEGVGRIRSDRIVLATGAGPAVPPVEGLEETGYLTNETAFEQDTLPDEMLVLGAGPIGLELAQVYARLGARVTVIEAVDRILLAEDVGIAAALQQILEEEGIRFVLGSPAGSVTFRDGRKEIRTTDGRTVRGDEILVATGRRPVTGALETERASVEREGAAIRVDDALRTTADGVWAAGDVTGGLQFTHVAEYMAKTALRNALLPFSSRVDYGSVPRVTYTDPEVAHVGLGRERAEERGGHTFEYPLDDLDRAVVDGDTAGWVQVSADRKGRVLGATVLGGGAGELIFPLVLAMKHGLTLADLADTVFPYPTRMEGVKRAANRFQTARLERPSGRLLRKVVQWFS